MAIQTEHNQSTQVRFGNWDLPNNTNQFTMCGWFSFIRTDTRQIIFGKNNGTGTANSVWAFHTDKRNDVRCILRINGSSTTLTSGSNVFSNNGEWHFMAMTYDGSTVRAYYDGTQYASANRTGNIDSSTNNVSYSGRADIANTREFGGFGEDIRVYTRALSQKELDQIQDSFGQDGIADDLYFNARFNELPTGFMPTTTDFVKDHGPNKFDGTANQGASPFYSSTSRNWTRRKS